MITIKKKEDCCGCSACVQICPIQCISFNKDDSGFFYPFVESSLCISCGLCEKVCPTLNKWDKQEPRETYAIKYDNDSIRLSSSSGGVFTLLAEQVIDDGGVVFGASFTDDWKVVHSYVEDKDELCIFRGSKYVQSEVGRSFILAESFLKSGRRVMFTGTPCQISALKRFLKKDYNNLLAVDIVCHGVPSPSLWEYYLTCVSKGCDDEKLLDISFRSKYYGWHNFSMMFKSIDKKGLSYHYYQSHNDAPYLKLYESNLLLRPSCYRCNAKGGTSRADITIGDFWGIENICPDFDDDKGISLVCVNNDSVNLNILEHDYVKFRKVEFNLALENNKLYYISPNRPLMPISFRLIKKIGFVRFMRTCFPIYSFLYKLQNKINSIINRN